MDIASRIYSIRTGMKLSQAKFGEMINMSQRSVAAWESGERVPSFPVLCELADRLGVTTDFLLGRDTSITAKEPTAMADGELRNAIIDRVQGLSDPALARVSDFLDGLQAGQEIASAPPADHDSTS